MIWWYPQNSIKIPYFDKSLFFHTHAVKKCVIVILSAQKLKQIHKFMDTKTCKILIDCLVISHLDHANDLPYETTDSVIKNSIESRMQPLACYKITLVTQ